jgi:hypothetical protein
MELFCILPTLFKAQGDQWTPNKEDCAELASTWDRYINAVPDETRFDSADEAALAALFTTILNFDTSDQEFGGNVYSDWSLWRSPNLHFGTYYFFSPAQAGGETSMRIQNTVSFWETRQGVYHTHPTDELWEFGWEQGNYDAFSPSDKWFAWLTGLSTYMSNETGTFVRWISTGDPSNVKISNNRVTRGRFPGSETVIQGAPSKQSWTRIKSCREAGYL